MKRAILTSVIAVILIPLIYLFLFSFFSYFKYPLVFPRHFSGESWNDVFFRNKVLGTGMLNSFILGILNGFFSTLAALLFARAVTKRDFPGKRAAEIIYSLPLFIPGITLFAGIHLISIRLSLNNTIAGVVMAHSVVTIPYSVAVISAFLRGISVNMEAAARTLGFRRSCVFIRIVLPLISPALSLSFSMGFLISFGEYLSTFLIGGGKVVSLATVMFPLIENGDRGHSSVLGFIFITLNLMIFFITDLVAGRLSRKTSALYGI